MDVTRTQFFRIPFTQVRGMMSFSYCVYNVVYGGRPERPANRSKPHKHKHPPKQQALDLVAHRQVFLERGLAYVPVERLVSIIVARFRATLSRGLLDAFSSYPYILADTRCVGACMQIDSMLRYWVTPE